MIPGTRKGECYICKECCYTEEHHIFGGTARRNESTNDGLTVHLCYEHHRGTKGAHGRDGKPVQDKLHREGQRHLEEQLMAAGMTAEEARAEFIRRYIKSYILD